MPHESVIELDILTGEGREVGRRPAGRATTPTSSSASPTPTAPWATPCGHPDQARARPSLMCTCATCPSPTSAPSPGSWRRCARIGGGVSYQGDAVDFVRRHRLSAPDECYLTLRHSWSDTAPFTQRLHPGPDLLPVDPVSAAPTGSPCGTTCGGGTPIGSGARRAFGAQHPLGAPPGRAAPPAQQRVLADHGPGGAVPPQGDRSTGLAAACRPCMTSSRT